MDKSVDPIIEFYPDPATGSARARRFADDNGDGKKDSETPVLENIELPDLNYIWSAGQWLSDVTDTATQRTYTIHHQQRRVMAGIHSTPDSGNIAFHTGDVLQC